MSNARQLSRDDILAMAASFKTACVLGAAAELDLFGRLDEANLTSTELAQQMNADARATAILMDALAALGILEKQADRYTTPEPLRPLLVEGTPQTVLPMLRHQMTCLRAWSQLARVAQSGKPAERQPSIRGAEADRAAFIAAMHSVSGPLADGLVARLGPPRFDHVLDVGGASGTWTLALLRAVPAAKATIFDLPDAIEQARARLGQSEYADRIALVAGDFYQDALPSGADLAWVSAIVHQHSREHNRALYAKVYAALRAGGQIMVRDFVMAESRVEPVEGALFAVNMLANTETGNTFTFSEFAEDLRAAGFVEPRALIDDGTMGSVVAACKP